MFRACIVIYWCWPALWAHPQGVGRGCPRGADSLIAKRQPRPQKARGEAEVRRLGDARVPRVRIASPRDLVEGERAVGVMKKLEFAAELSLLEAVEKWNGRGEGGRRKSGKKNENDGRPRNAKCPAKHPALALVSTRREPHERRLSEMFTRHVPIPPMHHCGGGMRLGRGHELRRFVVVHASKQRASRGALEAFARNDDSLCTRRNRGLHGARLKPSSSIGTSIGTASKGAILSSEPRNAPRRSQRPLTFSKASIWQSSVSKSHMWPTPVAA